MISVCSTVGITFGCISTIIIAACIGTSFIRVNDSEICEAFYPDGLADNNIKIAESSGAVFSGPGAEKHCITKATQHLRFHSSTTSGPSRVISILSNDGVPASLDLEIEWRINMNNVQETIKRLGYTLPEYRLYQTARAEVRNAASMFNVSSFLTGTRENIGLAIKDRLSNTLNYLDGVGVDIIKVNLQQINVHDEFEQRFQAVEDAKLQQLTAIENETLIRLEEEQLNQTEVINAEAQRVRLLREERALTVQANLTQQRLITEENTAAAQALIRAESDRINRLIRAETALAAIVDRRQLLVETVRRNAIANLTLAETERQNMEVIAQGRINRVLAQRDRDVARANIARDKQLEEVITYGINQTLAIFRTHLDANVTAERITSEGQANADEYRASERPKTTEFTMLRSTLGLSEHDLATLIMYRALGRSTNVTTFLDYKKQPFLLEGAKHPVSALASSS